MGGTLETTPHPLLPPQFPFCSISVPANFIANVPGEEVQVAKGHSAQHSQALKEILMPPSSPHHHHSRALSMLRAPHAPALAPVPDSRRVEDGLQPAGLSQEARASPQDAWPLRVSASPSKPSPEPLPSSPAMCLPLPSAQDLLLQTHPLVQNTHTQTT